MKIMSRVLAIMFLMCLLATVAMSADPAKPAEKPAAMPPMGPPAEMKEVAYLVGTWDYTMKMKMDPSSEQFMEMPMIATFSYILDGAALQAIHEGTMMGMKFQGIDIQTYDREKKLWQATWIDNMSARAGIYTGTRANGTYTVQGEDVMGGQTFQTRISTTNQTPKTFDWKMEMSMDQGKTWLVMGTATFTKRQG